jgi:hypothetical protein
VDNSQEQMTRGGLPSLDWLAHSMSRNLKRKDIGIDEIILKFKEIQGMRVWAGFI